ncbi:unnamed protein product [Spirodela intermedia]|uniref:Uncharacterized protein n=1 Tax=Spirodela intermedia TaxID=51605 RepID=A0A7I8L5W2_SPIIN|nr:unnamed protein product [Spirodela intermedia]
MACSSSLPWRHLQHTIDGPTHPFPPPSGGERTNNDRGSPPLYEATILSPRCNIIFCNYSDFFSMNTIFYEFYTKK